MDGQIHYSPTQVPFSFTRQTGVTGQDLGIRSLQCDISTEGCSAASAIVPLEARSAVKDRVQRIFEDAGIHLNIVTEDPGFNTTHVYYLKDSPHPDLLGLAPDRIDRFNASMDDDVVVFADNVQDKYGSEYYDALAFATAREIGYSLGLPHILAPSIMNPIIDVHETGFGISPLAARKKSAVPAFFNLAKFGAQLPAAPKITTYVAILASHPRDVAAC